MREKFTVNFNVNLFKKKLVVKIMQDFAFNL